MNFRTEIEIPKAPFELSHRDGVAMLGSCFSENIGTKLQRFRFNTLINSHGIVFNPISAAVALEDVLNNKQYTPDDLAHHNGLFVSLHHHGSFNHHDANSVLEKINEHINTHRQHLEKAAVLFVTFGSAWAYRFKQSQEIVTNCHKIPQANFDKILLTSEEITARWKALIEKLTAFNKHIQIVFTVSPVRYWRDGAIQNTLSKSHLIIAAHALKDTFENVHYFPAYELVTDDLRDYRFFAEDMLHPNAQAIQYVWEKLCDWCMSNKTKQTLQDLEPHLRFLEHRPLHESDEKYQEQKTKKEALIQKLLA